MRYKFWIGSIRYFGEIVEETSTHWIVDDFKIGRVELPKASTVRELGGVA